MAPPPSPQHGELRRRPGRTHRVDAAQHVGGEDEDKGRLGDADGGAEELEAFLWEGGEEGVAKSGKRAKEIGKEGKGVDGEIRM